MKKSYALNHEEREFLTSFEKGEWHTVKNIKKVKARARKIAAKTRRKDVCEEVAKLAL